MGEKIVANNLYEFLEYIRTKPGLFLGRKSITALHDFIHGYQTVCWLKDVPEKLIPDFGEFHDFVNNYYLHGSSTAGWKNVILSVHYGREEDAFDDFFRLLVLFREGYPKVNAKKIVLQVIQKMVNNPECLSEIDDANIVGYLKCIPSRLEEGQSLYDYESILYDFKEMAVYSEALSKLVTEVAGSQDWLDAQ
ncbi:MAG: hypothetical protein JNM41_03950 [Flavipsychrobacter sp.]|nr:hypothetical protein [Flavipsychrobacter sp.]